jgi:hypothetical protein
MVGRGGPRLGGGARCGDGERRDERAPRQGFGVLVGHGRNPPVPPAYDLAVLEATMPRKAVLHRRFVAQTLYRID